MLALCLHSAVRLTTLWWSAVLRPAGLRHLLLLLLAGPALALAWMGLWVGWLVDDLLFRGWRKVQIREPLFILGVPRSGTTSLHRAFATIPGTTTFSTWELWFGLSVTARKLVAGLARLDRRIGRPLTRLLEALERRTLGRLQEVHPTGLRDPEEDYFALTPLGACFILWLLFPREERVWQTARMDTALPARDRDLLMRWYRVCWQKHLYHHGVDRHPLSKNAAFGGCLSTLAEAFPDARFVCCWRPAEETVPSLLQSVDGAMSGAGLARLRPALRERLIGTMRHFYVHLYPTSARLASRSTVVSLTRQREDLSGILRATWEGFGRTLPEDMDDTLAHLDTRSRFHRSGHQYDPDTLGVDLQELATWPFASTAPE